jgi:hypothetical protein
MPKALKRAHVVFVQGNFSGALSRTSSKRRHGARADLIRLSATHGSWKFRD